MTKDAFLLLYSGPDDTHAVPFSSWKKCLDAFKTVTEKHGLRCNASFSESERTAYSSDPSCDIQWLKAYREVMQ